MFLIVRLLTLTTFLAHAVLGCCLLHGDCHRAHSTLADCDAEHSHEHAGGLNSVDKHHAVACEYDSDYCSSTEDETSHEHESSNGCDDAKCVFNAIQGLSASLDLQTKPHSFRPLVFTVLCLQDAEQVSLFGNQYDRPPRSSSERALLQVWLL